MPCLVLSRVLQDNWEPFAFDQHAPPHPHPLHNLSCFAAIGPLLPFLFPLQLIFDLFEDDDYHKVDVEVTLEASEGDTRTATSYVW